MRLGRIALALMSGQQTGDSKQSWRTRRSRREPMPNGLATAGHGAADGSLFPRHVTAAPASRRLPNARRIAISGAAYGTHHFARKRVSRKTCCWRVMAARKMAAQYKRGPAIEIIENRNHYLTIASGWHVDYIGREEGRH